MASAAKAIARMVSIPFVCKCQNRISLFLLLDELASNISMHKTAMLISKQGGTASMYSKSKISAHATRNVLALVRVLPTCSVHSSKLKHRWNSIQVSKIQRICKLHKLTSFPPPALNVKWVKYFSTSKWPWGPANCAGVAWLKRWNICGSAPYLICTNQSLISFQIQLSWRGWPGPKKTSQAKQCQAKPND